MSHLERKKTNGDCPLLRGDREGTKITMILRKLKVPRDGKGDKKMKTEEKRPSEDGTNLKNKYTTFRPYSMSRLLEYERCPQRFAFKYLQHLPEIQDNAGFQGQVIHEAIAKALKGEMWEDTLAELEFDDILDAKIKVLTALRYSKNLGNIVGIETKFAILDDGAITDFGDPDGFLRGIIDLLVEDSNGDLMIWDWKTGHSKPTKFQVFLYAWAVQKALKRPVSKVGYILLSSNDILEFDVSSEELEITERKLNKLVRTLEEDREFSATPGAHCSYCSYVAMCPLTSLIEAKDIPTVRNEREAVEVAKRIKVLEEELKHYEDALKGYVEEVGKVKIDENLWYGIKYSNVFKLNKNVDLNAMYKTLWEQSEDPTKIFKVENKVLQEKFPANFSVSKRKSFGFIEGGDKND